MRIILIVACVLFSGYMFAADGPQTSHPENRNIVGLNDGRVCFNNDGAVETVGECNVTPVDEGFVSLSSSEWKGGGASGINGCGTAAVDPVSNAICPLTLTSFATCDNDEYVLVQTTRSGHYFSIEPYNDCAAIYIFGLTPCLKSDSFDPATGCTPTDNPPQFSIENGYIQLDDVGFPPDSHCADASHYGRMSVDGELDRLYICTKSGWSIR